MTEFIQNKSGNSSAATGRGHLTYMHAAWFGKPIETMARRAGDKAAAAPAIGCDSRHRRSRAIQTGVAVEL